MSPTTVSSDGSINSSHGGSTTEAEANFMGAQDNANSLAGANGAYEMSVLFEFVVPGVLLNCIGVLGLVGNLLSIIVLSRPQMKSSINCILIGKIRVLLLSVLSTCNSKPCV